MQNPWEGKRKQCQVEGCDKGALSGGRCSAHGGGRRCQEPGCDKAPASGGRCIIHAGKKRNRSLIDGRELEVTRCVRFKSPPREPNPQPNLLAPLYLSSPDQEPNPQPNLLAPLYMPSPNQEPIPKPNVLVPLYLQNPAPIPKPNVLVPLYMQRSTVMPNSIPEKSEFQDFPNFGTNLFLVSSRF